MLILAFLFTLDDSIPTYTYTILKLYLEHRSFREIGQIIGKAASTVHSVVKK